MSVEDAEQFHTRLNTDSELRDSVMEASDRILEIAREHDLDFTREELAAVFIRRFSEVAARDPDHIGPFTSIMSERPAQ